MMGGWGVVVVVGGDGRRIECQSQGGEEREQQGSGHTRVHMDTHSHANTSHFFKKEDTQLTRVANWQSKGKAERNDGEKVR